MSTNPKAPYWKKDPARLFLLANFIGPQSLDELAIPPELVQALGEDPHRVLRQLLQAGALEYVDPDEPPERIYSRIRVRELQALLEARDLEVSGTKQELLNRLANANHEALYCALLSKTQLQCTEEAQPIAIDHLTTEGRSLLSKLNLPDEWWLKFLVRVAEWIAAGVLGNWVYDALTKADEQPPPEVLEQSPTLLAPTPPQFPWRGQVAGTSANCALTRVMGLTLDRNGGIAGYIWVHFWADGWDGAWAKSTWGVNEGYPGMDDSSNWDGVLTTYAKAGTWKVCVVPAEGSWECISTTVTAQTVAKPCAPESGGIQIIRIVFQEN